MGDIVLAENGPEIGLLRSSLLLSGMKCSASPLKLDEISSFKLDGVLNDSKLSSSSQAEMA